MFDLFIESSQCKHVVFAGCHDGGYISLLTPHKKESRRITLLKSTFCSARFRALGFGMMESRGVFRSVTLDTVEGASDGTGVPQVLLSISNLLYGTFHHPESSRSSDPANTFKGLLDKVIHINRQDQRIDPPMQAATDAGQLRYRRRVKARRLCHDFQLLGRCSGSLCVYDHGYVDPELLLIMKHEVRKQRCSKGVLCRSFDCYYGHACSHRECGGGKSCKFSAAQHGLDFEAVKVLKET